MTVPRRSVTELTAMASRLGCVGVELRNDLDVDLFAAEAVADVLGVAEIPSFNDPALVDMNAARKLMAFAKGLGAPGVALIPHVSDQVMDRAAQRDALMAALISFQPIFEELGLIGMIEPLGFETSTLRFQDDVATTLEAMGNPDCFAMIHDTFHYHLAGGGDLHPEITGLVHISGIDDPEPTVSEMRDHHRVLVGPNDRLGNVEQIRALRAEGYSGPFSFEAFAPDIHDMRDPEAALRGSIDFISSQLSEIAA
jgi:2-keto-myo-inositol isomerase